MKIKTHETDPRCCSKNCGGMLYTRDEKQPSTFFCQCSQEILSSLNAGSQGQKLLRTARCLRKYGV